MATVGIAFLFYVCFATIIPGVVSYLIASRKHREFLAVLAIVGCVFGGFSLGLAIWIVPVVLFFIPKKKDAHLEYVPPSDKPPAPSVSIYLQDRGSAAGPYPIEQVRDLLRTGVIQKDHLASSSPQGPWVPVQQFNSIVRFTPEGSPPSLA